MKSLTYVSYYSLITSAGERFLQQAKIRQMKYKIEYLKGLEIFIYENVSLLGSFANWNEDRRSNVGFQALNEDMEPRRFRYDSVKAITLMKWNMRAQALFYLQHEKQDRTSLEPRKFAWAKPNVPKRATVEGVPQGKTMGVQDIWSR